MRMQNILNAKVKNIMTDTLITSRPNMILTEVSNFFKMYSFHHLPVLNENQECVGIISKSDYHQLQDKFTKMDLKHIDISNEEFFGSLIAKEVMTPNPISINLDKTIDSVIDIFLQNKVHAVIVTDNGKCVGIITPYDILKSLKTETYV